MEEKKMENEKVKKFWIYAGVVVLILVAVIISLLFYKQKIETTNTVFKNLTEDWREYKDDRLGISFKYPKDWTINAVKSLDIDHIICKGEMLMTSNGCVNQINLRISSRRSFDTNNPDDAIQISIPFDKQNYIIFSTSTNSDSKEIFYNIPVTLVIGK